MTHATFTNTASVPADRPNRPMLAASSTGALSGAASTTLFDIDLLQQMQDDFARRHGLAVIAVDATGTPITRASSFTPFCELMRRRPEHQALCAMCDAHGGLQSAIDGRPYLYQCHAGLVDLSAPIRFENQYVGAILCGQVRLPDQRMMNPVVPRMTEWRDNSELREAHRFVPIASEGHLLRVAEELFGLAAEVVAECRPETARPKLPQDRRVAMAGGDVRPVTTTHWDLTALASAIAFEDLPRAVDEIDVLLDDVFENDNVRLGKQNLVGLEDSLIDLAAQASPKLGFEVGQQVLRHRALGMPRQKVHLRRVDCATYIETLVFHIFDGLYHDRTFAPKSIPDLLNYIERHPTRCVTLTEAATYINCTPAHLSRTFRQHTGRTFVQYLTERRIGRARMLLTHSDLPVQSVATRLGFQPVSHFCRIFKRETGQTPSEFRRSTQQQIGAA